MGLIMNTTKTKIMTNQDKPRKAITVDGPNIEIISYINLEQQLSLTKDSQNLEIKSRWAAYWNFKQNAEMSWTPCTGT